MILANDFSSGLIRFQKLLAQMANRVLLDLARADKVEQDKAYLNAMQNPKHPLHHTAKEEKGCKLARGKSWMGQAEQSI